MRPTAEDRPDGRADGDGMSGHDENTGQAGARAGRQLPIGLGAGTLAVAVASRSP
jgi:hypothetical protein